MNGAASKSARSKSRAAALAALFGLALAVAPALAQSPPAGWQTGTDMRIQPPAPPDLRPSTGWTPVAPAPPPAAPAPRSPPSNTTVIPRAPEPPGAAAQATTGEVALVALLTADGQGIDQGLVWRVFRDGAEPAAKPVATSRDATPTLRLPPGDYIINAAFGRAYLSRKVSITAGQQRTEQFVLNVGGLRLTPVLANNEPLPERSVTFDIFSDDRDQFGNRIKVISGAKPGVIIRLNAGIYNVVSTYGDANAVARADVTVEAGKLTETALVHGGCRVTFKLVTRPGGEAIADTQWLVATAKGDPVKETVGALPTHIFAPGSYFVTARHMGRTYQRGFTVKDGDVAEVEVVIQ
jgi:hypothetical protein